MHHHQHQWITTTCCMFVILAIFQSIPFGNAISSSQSVNINMNSGPIIEEQGIIGFTQEIITENVEKSYKSYQERFVSLESLYLTKGIEFNKKNGGGKDNLWYFHVLMQQLSEEETAFNDFLAAQKPLLLNDYQSRETYYQQIEKELQERDNSLNKYYKKYEENGITIFDTIKLMGLQWVKDNKSSWKIMIESSETWSNNNKEKESKLFATSWKIGQQGEIRQYLNGEYESSLALYDKYSLQDFGWWIRDWKIFIANKNVEGYKIVNDHLRNLISSSGIIDFKKWSDEEQNLKNKMNTFKQSVEKLKFAAFEQANCARKDSANIQMTATLYCGEPLWRKIYWKVCPCEA